MLSEKVFIRITTLVTRLMMTTMKIVITLMMTMLIVELMKRMMTCTMIMMVVIRLPVQMMPMTTLNTVAMKNSLL